MKYTVLLKIRLCRLEALKGKYFILTLLTTRAFVLACNNARVDASTHKQPLNLFTVFVGYPGTGEYKICIFGFTVVLPTLSYLFLPFGNILHGLDRIWLVFQTHSVSDCLDRFHLFAPLCSNTCTLFPCQNLFPSYYFHSSRQFLC